MSEARRYTAHAHVAVDIVLAMTMHISSCIVPNSVKDATPKLSELMPNSVKDATAKFLEPMPNSMKDATAKSGLHVVVDIVLAMTMLNTSCILLCTLAIGDRGRKEGTEVGAVKVAETEGQREVGERLPLKINLESQ